MSIRDVRVRLASAWLAVAVAVGATSGFFELAGDLGEREVFGRGLIDRWAHVCDPLEARLPRTFGAATPIVSALRRAEAPSCWYRRHSTTTDPARASSDLMILEAVAQLFFPALFEELAPGIDPASSPDRWLLDLDPSRPVAWTGFERVDGNRRFALWRPAARSP